MRSALAFLGIGISNAFAIGACFAATIRVPEDAPSVLAGVDQAVAGDSVLVGPGTWTDRERRIVILGGSPRLVMGCAFPRGGVTLIGVNGPEQTIIDVDATTTSGLVNAITIANQVGAGDVLIEGFTITGALGSELAQAVVAVDADKASFRSCHFVENIRVVEGSNFALEMIDCDISGNKSEASLISIFESRALLDQCRFRNNFGRCVEIDSEYVGAPVPHIEVKNCEFTDNRSAGFGTCLDLLYANIMVSGNLFLRNVAEEKPAAGLRASECFGVVEFNVFAYDSTLGLGSSVGGVWWIGSNGYVRNNTFIGCHGTHGPVAFLSSDESWLGFQNNIVTHSTGGAAIEDRSFVVYGHQCNLFWANTEGDFEGYWPYSPTNLFVDPLYCGFEKLDFTLREDSPAIVGGCGQIGALGIGCKGVSVEPMSWGKIKGLYRLSR